jgi:glutamine synthetase
MDALPLPSDAICLEYVWLTADAVSGNPGALKSKTKIVSKAPDSVQDCPDWAFDGEASNQAPGIDTEVVLHPVALFADPFRGRPNHLVLCECLKQDRTPIASNTRNEASRFFRRVPESEPWFGIEQEVTLFEADKRTPLGWPQHGVPEKDSVYCDVGVDVIGRNVLEALLNACLFAGVKLSGTNLECMPSMIEYQIGPCLGIEAADHLWMSRYILCRLCEALRIHCSFDPKPVQNYSGAGCHTNVSTKAMRDEGGYENVLIAIEKLSKCHKGHIAVYGVGNEERLTGMDDAPSIEVFTFGVATRAGSVRIPRDVERNHRGFLEDRRPAANCDPYMVCGKLYKTIVLT